MICRTVSDRFSILLMKWILLTLIFTQFAFAGSYQQTSKDHCPAIDLRDQHLKEIRNQKKVSWCYAFTAADMLTYTFDLPEKASAADVAINYNDSSLGQFTRWLIRTFGRNATQGEQENFMMPHQTGFNKVALDRAMRDGYCPERVFPSEAWTKMSREGSNWLESKADLRTSMLEIFTLIKEQQNLNAANLPFYFHFKNVESPEAFLNLIKASNSSNFYSNLRKVVCQNDRIKFADRLETVMYLKDALTFSVMNKQLNHSRIIGIDYDSRLLEDSQNSSVSLSRLHTSSIVARRWNETQHECQYLVRDSYAKQCRKYDVCYECEGGQVWIDESKIYSNLLSFVYIIKK